MPSIVSVSILSLITPVYFIIAEGISNVSYVGLIFINTAIMGMSMFSKERQPFTLQKMVNLFMYVFFVVANAIQFARSTRTLTFRLSFSEQDYIAFQVMVLIISILFNGVYSMLYKSQRKKMLSLSYKREHELLQVNEMMLILFSCLATFWIIVQFRSNPLRLFFRGIEDDTLYHASNAYSETSTGLLMDKVVRPFPFIALMLSGLCKSRNETKWLLLILTLIVSCPTGLSRNAAAMVWLPLFIVYFGKHLKKNIFIWAMVVALFVIFPFFNIFRHWNGSLEFSWSMDFLNDINFDASQIFMATVKTDFITYGYQLLGVLFFFIPRSLWPSKPVGSGHALVDMNYGYFNNVSMPYFSEGYVNFGAIGVVIFTIFLSWISVRLDTAYWFKWKNTKDFRQGYYLISIGMVIFIMRGDLMSSFTYTVGVVVVYTLCVFLVTNHHFSRLRLKR